MRIIIIAAVARNRVIGRNGKVPWHLPEDLARFRTLTMGHTLLMGRRTYESIGRTLPGRRTLVITSTPIPGVESARSPGEGLRALPPDETVFVIGGARLFSEFLGRADLLYLTRVDQAPEGDTYFPLFEHLLAGPYRLLRREEHAGFTFEEYERKTAP